MSEVMKNMGVVSDWYRAEDVSFRIDLPKYRPFSAPEVSVEIDNPGKKTSKKLFIRAGDKVELIWPLEARWDDTGGLIGEDRRYIGFVLFKDDGSSVEVSVAEDQFAEQPIWTPLRTLRLGDGLCEFTIEGAK